MHQRLEIISVLFVPMSATYTLKIAPVGGFDKYRQGFSKREHVLEYPPPCLVDDGKMFLLIHPIPSLYALII